MYGIALPFVCDFHEWNGYGGTIAAGLWYGIGVEDVYKRQLKKLSISPCMRQSTLNFSVTSSYFGFIWYAFSNLALLNYYFRSKEKLFDISMKESLQEMFGLIVNLVNAEDINPVSYTHLAIDYPYTDQDGVTRPKFVNLDMEEYKEIGRASCRERV